MSELSEYDAVRKAEVEGETELPLHARARHGDPSTSHAAAKSVGELTENQRAVMTALRLAGRPMLDEELIDYYRYLPAALRLPPQSDSGIRSRRAELAAAGLLIQGEKKRMSTNRFGRTWTIKPEEE